MAAPEWFVGYLDALRRVPGSRPASARALAEWAAQIGDAEAPSRPTISRWLSGATLPTGFRPLELMVLGVRERSRNPSRQVRETLLRAAWWHDAYERALRESGRGNGADGHATQLIYQGLEPFARADAERFFGRARDIEAVRARLEGLYQSSTGGILLVLGQSGIGKSSLLAAGLLPALAQHGLSPDTAVAEWPAEVITPGPEPLRALAEALHDGDGDGAPASAEGAAVRPTSERQMILVVDQFEEIFQADQEVRHQFVTALLDMATPRATDDDAGAGHAAAIVVLACRNEFYPDLRKMPSLKPVLDAPFNLDPLTGEALTEAIKEPARRAGITVGNDLVNRLLADAGVSNGGMIEGKLPLISHVLRLMNQSGPMTVRAYDRVGGLDGAVAHTATQAWERLQTAGVGETALALLVRMVRVGDHPGQDTHQRLSRHEVVPPAGGPTAHALDVLAAARLVTVGETTVQITHEALWREWPLLRDAIDSERTDHVRRQAIERSARLWDEAGRPDEQLHRGTLLTDAHRVTTGPASGAVSGTRITREFLAAADAQEHRFARRRRRLRAAAVSE